MEQFYFEIPTIERKDDALDFLFEHAKYNSKINGTSNLDRCLEGIPYEDWLADCLGCFKDDYAAKRGFVPASTFFTVRKSDNKIVGMVNIRHYLNDFLKKFGGHIGYDIRPTERRKGYAKIQLYLALIECNKLGIDKAMLECVDTNIGSDKTIQALGGEFEENYYDEKNNETLKHYWINVKESLEKYKDKC